MSDVISHMAGRPTQSVVVEIEIKMTSADGTVSTLRSRGLAPINIHETWSEDEGPLFDARPVLPRELLSLELSWRPLRNEEGWFYQTRTILPERSADGGEVR